MQPILPIVPARRIDPMDLICAKLDAIAAVIVAVYEAEGLTPPAVLLAEDDTPEPLPTSPALHLVTGSK